MLDFRCFTLVLVFGVVCWCMHVKATGRSLSHNSRVSTMQCWYLLSLLRQAEVCLALHAWKLLCCPVVGRRVLLGVHETVDIFDYSRHGSVQVRRASQSAGSHSFKINIIFSTFVLPFGAFLLGSGKVTTRLVEKLSASCEGSAL